MAELTRLKPDKLPDIKTESLEKKDIETKFTEGSKKSFTKIEEISSVLEELKDEYNQTFNYTLNPHEINRLITKTLNAYLLGKPTIQELYNKFMNEDYDNVLKKVEIIIDEVKKFNEKNNNKFFVDLEKIKYILWFEEVKFIKNLIEDINNKLKNNLDVIYIITEFIIALYNEPRYTKYYIIILQLYISDLNNNDGNEELKKFFENNILDIVNKLISIILSYDTEFLNLINNFEKDKLEKLKTLNFNSIYNLEVEFHKKKEELLSKSRDIDIDKIFGINTVSTVDNNENSVDKNLNIIDLINKFDNNMWIAFNLFIFKKFNIKDKNAYISMANNIVQDKKLELDDFDNLKFPVTIHLKPIEPLLKGGNDKYFNKYLKYKKKYIELKSNN